MEQEQHRRSRATCKTNVGILSRSLDAAHLYAPNTNT
jgi:hypothetical protein